LNVDQIVYRPDPQTGTIATCPARGWRFRHRGHHTVEPGERGKMRGRAARPNPSV